MISRPFKGPSGCEFRGGQHNVADYSMTTEVAYSLEAMRALLMLGANERGRAIETIEKLASAYDVLCAERDISAATGVVPGDHDAETAAADNSDDPAADEDGTINADTGETGSSNTDAADEQSSGSPEETKPAPAAEALHIPGTLALGTSGNFCLAPFSQTGDFVVALDDNITVVSLIDVVDGLNEANSE